MSPNPKLGFFLKSKFTLLLSLFSEQGLCSVYNDFILGSGKIGGVVS